MGKAKDVLQSSHEHEATKLVEERNTLKKTLSSKQVKLRTMEEERKAYEKQVCAWISYLGNGINSTYECIEKHQSIWQYP